MISWKITDVSSIVEIFVCFTFILVLGISIVDVSISTEHAVGVHWLSIIHVWVVLVIIWWLVSSHEIWINLLVWINTLIIVILLIILSSISHITFHATHVIVSHFLATHILKLLLVLWYSAIMWLLVVIAFTVHFLFVILCL